MPKAKNKKNKTIKGLKRQTTAFILFIVLTLSIGGYLGYIQFREYSATAIALEEGKKKIEELQISSSRALNEYGKVRTEFAELNTETAKRLQEIFPSDEQYTLLARSIDKAVKDINTPNDPIFLSDVRFERPQFMDDLDYAILPISLTIQGTEKGLKDFMEYVENTGNLNTNDRIMDIQSINISFVSTQGDSQRWNVSLKANAYFQKKT